MIKLISTPLALVLACLFTRTAALPSMPVVYGVASDQSENYGPIPRTLLGMPYRSRWYAQAQDRLPSQERWMRFLDVAVADPRHDVDCDVDSDVNVTEPYPAQTGTLIGEGNGTEANSKAEGHARVPLGLPLPLVLDASSTSSLALARPRLVRLKRPRLARSNGSDDTPLSGRVRSSEGIHDRDVSEQHVPSIDVAENEGEIASHKPQLSMHMRRWTRMYSKGEWKSRLADTDASRHEGGMPHASTNRLNLRETL